MILDLFMLFLTVIYLRVLAIYYTRQIISMGGVEANLLLVPFIKSNVAMFLILIMLLVFAAYFYFEQKHSGTFLLLFILWIDFQHDFELAVAMKKAKKLLMGLGIKTMGGKKNE